MNETLTIDVWSDVVCPFCYLGKRQLETALAQYSGDAVFEVRLHAFELDPSAPADYGRPLSELLAKKYGVDVNEAERWHRRSEADAAALGMTWRMDLARTGNTFDAHRLNALATTQGLGLHMNERLMRGYFGEGMLPSDRDALRGCANDVGVKVPNGFFESDDFAELVRADEAAATELGISGVPTLIIDHRFVISGAQGADTILATLNRAIARRQTTN